MYIHTLRKLECCDVPGAAPTAALLDKSFDVCTAFPTRPVQNSRPPPTPQMPPPSPQLSQMNVKQLQQIVQIQEMRKLREALEKKKTVPYSPPPP